ncbi:MAG: ABC transporter substrate-binding protein [Verrucomicrobia bacterium]|nr:ABC transporter substrate-binding protein [Verrucomicrobiota bacterium]
MDFLLGHSPDPDDAFMFYAMAQHKIDLRGHRFEHILQDIETLNQRALRGELHITAVSIHAYAYLTDRYSLLPCGASMGDGYGPMLVSLDQPPSQPDGIRDWLESKTIAIPGLKTSAYLALRLFAPEVHTVAIPFDEIFDAVKTGKSDVGLIIHEGQITYADQGFKLALDLGSWWKSLTGLPLPLGGNVIRKDIPRNIQKEVADILKESIGYGLKHRKAGVEHSMPLARGLDQEGADRFIGMYVNDFTIDYGPTGRHAIREFLGRAGQQGLIPEKVSLEFVE